MESVVSYTGGGMSLVMSRTEAHEWTVTLVQKGRLTFEQTYGTRKAAVQAVERIEETRRKI